MQKTTTFLMFVGDHCGKAKEAIHFYTSIFPDSEIRHIRYFNPADVNGKQDLVMHCLFTIAGQEYIANDGPGPHKFTFTPAISIFVQCESETEINTLFQKLSEGGSTLMPLGNYAFSQKFGWLNDKYGVSWQLNLQS